VTEMTCLAGAKCVAWLTTYMLFLSMCILSLVRLLTLVL
jgi:hypothetical protein